MAKTPIDALLDQIEFTEIKRDAPVTSDLPYAVMEGTLKLGDAELKCYVLNTGERVFDAGSVEKFFTPLQNFLNDEIIGYRVTQDCTLDRTNFYEGDEIIIEDHAYDFDWKGTDWFDQFPQIFEPIYVRTA